MNPNTQNVPFVQSRPQLRTSITHVGLAIIGLVVFLAGCSPGIGEDQQVSRGTSLPAPIQAEVTLAASTARISGQITSTTRPDSLQEPTRTPAPTPTLIPLPTPNPWSGSERVNILLLGVDYGDWNSPDRVGPSRSDTMILFTIDPATKTAGMLSIPRDLWVDIPGMLSPNRINTAHRFGELYELPGGGPALAARTVEKLLGVPVHYYARIDFSSFERFIDELGGVEVDVPGDITIDPIGSGNTIELKSGWQTLDGPAALAYARNRSTPGDETDRANRQQQIIMAIRDRMLKLNGLPMLVYKAPGLYNELKAGIETNLSLDKAIQLAWLAIQVDLDNIQSAVIGPNEYIMDTTEEGWAIFRPIPERIQWLIQQMFSTP